MARVTTRQQTGPLDHRGPHHRMYEPASRAGQQHAAGSQPRPHAGRDQPVQRGADGAAGRLGRERGEQRCPQPYRIEITDRRFQGKFMARDYVSIREESRGGRTLWTFTSVTHERLKSAPARVTRRSGRYTVLGAAWGAPIAKVEVRIDGGPWQATKLVRNLSRSMGSGHRDQAAWKFWTLSWGTPARGEHTITSRAYDTDGNVQPTPTDPYLTSKRTFWENNGHMTRRVMIP